jgi:hypothetical protein
MTEDASAQFLKLRSLTSPFGDVILASILPPSNEEAEQAETQQPLSAALFTCLSLVSTSTP